MHVFEPSPSLPTHVLGALEEPAQCAQDITLGILGKNITLGNSSLLLRRPVLEAFPIIPVTESQIQRQDEHNRPAVPRGSFRPADAEDVALAGFVGAGCLAAA